jgi:hypothetical protein
MIVKESGDSLMLIGQSDHADLAAQVAAHWGNSTFSVPLPNSDMLCATSLHDEGWRLLESNPEVNQETNRPYNYYEMPRSLKVHEATISSVNASTLYVRLMVSMHRTGLVQDRYGTGHGWKIKRKTGLDPKTKSFVQRHEAWQSKAKQAMKKNKTYREFANPRYIWMNFKLLQTWDKISLYVCGEPRQAGEVYPTPSGIDKKDLKLVLQRRDGNKISFDPWPFGTRPVKITLRAISIPNKQYTSQEGLCNEVYRGERVSLSYELV